MRSLPQLYSYANTPHVMEDLLLFERLPQGGWRRLRNTR